MNTRMQSAPSPVELIAMIERYNEVTERLKRSHETLRDEVIRLRDELHGKNKELRRRERLAALGEMAAGLAHEIRNPLGGIRLYASLMERDLVDRPRTLELVHKLESGVRSLDSIVSDILAFAGGAEPEFAPTPIGRMLTTVLAQCTPQADQKGVSIGVESGIEDIEVLCDGNQMERALLNLVLNALDAVPRYGHIWFRAGRDAGESASDGAEFFHLSVEDDGPGIPQELLQRVFHPFFTTKHTGTGLGLAIVHRIVEANGGRICANNRPEGGAAFELTMPFAHRRDATQHTGLTELHTGSIECAMVAHVG